MTHRTRRLIFCSIVVFFILATPTILLYAWGYSFDWQEKKIVLTGGLYLKSTPKKADIYLNGKLKDQTPSFIKRLVPKDYQIEIAKEGFHSWSKKLKVESKIVTEAKNILLVPQNPDTEIVLDELTTDFSIEEFLNQEESNNVFYIQKPSYILYKTDQNNSFQEQISSTPLPDEEYEIIASPNERIAVLSETGKLYLLDQEERSFELIGQNVKGVQFAKDNKKLLYFTSSEIWVCYLENITNQVSKKIGQKELITRLSQEIKQAIWHSKTNQHIIFLVGQDVKIVELDGREERNIVDVLKTDSSQIFYQSEENKVYFIQDGKLLRASLE
jgi:hypothetical protein